MINNDTPLAPWFELANKILPSLDEPENMSLADCRRSAFHASYHYEELGVNLDNAEAVASALYLLILTTVRDNKPRDWQGIDADWIDNRY